MVLFYRSQTIEFYFRISLDMGKSDETEDEF